jgi:hypothetical protein
MSIHIKEELINTAKLPSTLSKIILDYFACDLCDYNGSRISKCEGCNLNRCNICTELCDVCILFKCKGCVIDCTDCYEKKVCNNHDGICLDCFDNKEAEEIANKRLEYVRGTQAR